MNPLNLRAHNNHANAAKIDCPRFRVRSLDPKSDYADALRFLKPNRRGNLSARRGRLP